MYVKHENRWLCLLLLAAVLLAELYFGYGQGRWIPKDAEILTVYPEELAYVSGYDREGGRFVPNNDDPQLGIIVTPDKWIGWVAAVFSGPVSENIPVQVYFARSGAPLCPESVTTATVPKGAASVLIPLPAQKYEHVRVDINGSFSLERIDLYRTGFLDSLLPDIGRSVITCWTVTLSAALIVWAYRRSRVEKERPAYVLRRFGQRDTDQLTGRECLFLLFCFAVYFLWAVLFTDLDYGPDERMRYAVPRFIFENGALPCGWEDQLIDRMWGFSYGFSISLPYLISALFMRIASLFTLDPAVLFIASRMTSVLSVTGMGYYAVRISKCLLNGPARWIFIILMTLSPQIVFLGSYNNLDSFEMFTVMMILYAWIRCTRNNWDRPGCVRLGFAMGLCLLSYKFAYSYVLCSLFLYCAWYLRNRKHIAFGDFMKRGLGMLAIVFAVSGWYFIRNAVIYDGDFLSSFRVTDPWAEKFAQNSFKPSLHFTWKKAGLSIGGMLAETEWIKYTVKSVFYVLGAMELFGIARVYGYFHFVLALAAGGVLYAMAAAKYRKKRRPELPVLLFAALASAITVFISVYYSWARDYQPQGRYIMAAMPLVYLSASKCVEGLTGLIRKERLRLFAGKAAALVLCASLLSITAAAFYQCLARFLP